jgi:glycosyltransferase involved in cell wall biosynthesis
MVPRPTERIAVSAPAGVIRPTLSARTAARGRTRVSQSQDGTTKDRLRAAPFEKGLCVTTRFGFISTYPPTQCGLATFSASLYRELVTTAGGIGRVISLVDTPQPRSGPEVVGQLVAGDAAGPHRVAHLLADTDVVIVQHEYGVYGGADGDEAVALLGALTVPSIVVLHTVLSSPSPHQREVLEAVVDRADAVVTMTETARNRLAVGYQVDLDKVSVIPHGAPVARRVQSPLFRTAQPTVLTWGLIGPGKGIEWGIRAMAALRDLDPAPRYVVAGQTHPKVLLHHGESYRDSLLGLIREQGLQATVTLDAHYRNSAALAELVSAADVVLLPYDSTDQVTSGVLIEAMAAAKPVVATRFPHAVELLSNGAGIVVPQKDPGAMAEALRTVLTRRDVAAKMARAAESASTQLHWPEVARRYHELAGQLIGKRVAA